MSEPAPTTRATATRNDVARLAGVSTAVVSYVVNGSKRVSPATEAKVRDAIALLGYRPNQAARALKLGSSQMLGMIVPDATNPFFASLAHTIEEFAAERGYALLIANSNGMVETERRHLENLVSRRVDGIFLCSVLPVPDLRDLAAAEIPGVVLDHDMETPHINSVGVDLREGSRMAVAHLVEHGHRDIGLIVGVDANIASDRRELGWRHGLEEAGRAAGIVLRASFDHQGGYQAGRSLVSSSSRPTAVFVSSDMQGVGLLRAVHEAGLRVPEDLAIISFDGSVEAEYSWPPLTTVAQPVEDMARAAIEALLDRGSDKRNRSFKPTLVRRASCGCPRLQPGPSAAGIDRS